LVTRLTMLGEISATVSPPSQGSFQKRARLPLPNTYVVAESKIAVQRMGS
jgi:hypothetical protein